MKKIFAVWEFLTLTLNQHFLKKLRDEINEDKNRGNRALKSHYQYIRQLDFIQNHVTMFNPLCTVSNVRLRPCLHGVWDPGLVG